MALEISISETGKYITGNAFLRMRAWSSQPGELQFTGEILTLNGVREFHSTNLPLVGDRIAVTRTYKMPEGILINWQCRVMSGNIRVGRCYVKAQIRNVVGGVTLDYSSLFSGYVNTTTEVAYPGSLLTNSLEEPGRARGITGTTPAAGAECFEVVPVNTRQRFATFRATLTTSDDVADRVVRLMLGGGDPGPNEQIFPAIVPQKKNETRIYNWQEGATPFVAEGNHHVLFLAGYPSFPSAIIARTQTENLQALDQWSAIYFAVQEWIEV